MVYADGSRYLGQWRSDKRDGNGRLTYSNGILPVSSFGWVAWLSAGDTYEGQWTADQWAGTGCYRFAADGSLYQGCFRAGIPIPIVTRALCLSSCNVSQNIQLPPTHLPLVPLLAANQGWESRGGTEVEGCSEP